MKVPDYISPVVAHRAWQWDATGLKSLCGEPWHPRQPLAATCRALVRGNVFPVHDAPQMNCTCGIYAAKSRDHLRRVGYAAFGIHGEVCLWGTVVEHELGWRAQYAYPKNFFLPLEMLPISVSLLEPRFNTLAAYGCDIHITGREGNMPLWLKGSGYEASALELLVRRCKNWYARRQQERRIRHGDCVALRGRGIVVVEYADDMRVHAVLGKRESVRLPRRDIAWNDTYSRWEASVSA